MGRLIQRTALKLPSWAKLPDLLNQLGQRCYFPAGSTPERVFVNAQGGELCETEDNVYVLTDNGDAKRIPKSTPGLLDVLRDFFSGGTAWQAAVVAVDTRLRRLRRTAFEDWT